MSCSRGSTSSLQKIMRFDETPLEIRARIETVHQHQNRNESGGGTLASEEKKAKNLKVESLFLVQTEDAPCAQLFQVNARASSVRRRLHQTWRPRSTSPVRRTRFSLWRGGRRNQCMVKYWAHYRSIIPRWLLFYVRDFWRLFAGGADDIETETTKCLNNDVRAWGSPTVSKKQSRNILFPRVVFDILSAIDLGFTCAQHFRQWNGTCDICDVPRNCRRDMVLQRATTLSFCSTLQGEMREKFNTNVDYFKPRTPLGCCFVFLS